MHDWNISNPSNSLFILPNKTTSSQSKLITLLEPKDISPFDPNNRTFLSFFGGDLIGQGYFQIKNERKYFVFASDPLSKNWKRGSPKKTIDAVTARRLMMEVLDFIEDLMLVGAFIEKPLS